MLAWRDLGPVKNGGEQTALKKEKGKT